MFTPCTFFVSVIKKMLIASQKKNVHDILEKDQIGSDGSPGRTPLRTILFTGGGLNQRTLRHSLNVRQGKARQNDFVRQGNQPRGPVKLIFFSKEMHFL